MDGICFAGRLHIFKSMEGPCVFASASINLADYVGTESIAFILTPISSRLDLCNKVASCHAMSWLHVSCHILVCRDMPYICVLWRVIIIPVHVVSVFRFAKIDPVFVVEKMSTIYARPLPRVYAIFLFAIEYPGRVQIST